MQRDFKGIWIPKDIWLNKDLTIMEKLFYVEIDSLDCSEEHCYASNEYFAQFFDLSKNRSSEIIKSLEKKGLITIEYLYKENSKQIDKRIIKVFDKSKGGIRKIDSTPSEKCEDNNTTINNKDIYVEIINKWNSISELSNIIKLSDKRKKLINSLIKKYSEDKFFIAIDNVSNSGFLKGDNKRNWKCTIDWLLTESNFLKTIEGNYNINTTTPTKTKTTTPPANVNVNDIINNLRSEDI